MEGGNVALRKSISKKKLLDNGVSDQGRRSSAPSRSGRINGERTVKRLRMSKALTVPDSTTVYEACRRMAARRVDAILVTDSNALLCGILTDKDIAVRVIAAELNLQETTVGKVMTRNPLFVLSDTLSVEALQKMVQGKFRHLPVVENGEVIALLDIAKCLYDAIAKMERAMEKGKAIAAAVEGVEKQWDTSTSGTNTVLEALRERMFRPSIEALLSEKKNVAVVGSDASVLTATKKMLELHVNSAVITNGNKIQGILTSKDILMRVIAQNLSPESTYVEKVMTANPEFATVDTSIVDALHIMHDGKFLHLPVVDREGSVVAVVDVLQITNAAISTVGNAGVVGNDTATTMMQKFWDSAMSLAEDDDTRSEGSTRQPSEATEAGKPSYIFDLGNTFRFKLEDKKGRMHRFNCDTGSMTELIACIIQRTGDDIDRNYLPQIMYEDEEHDRVVLATDSDLAAAVEHAKLAGWKSLRLHVDYYGSSSGSDNHSRREASSGGLEFGRRNSWAAAYSTVAASAAVVAGLGVMAYLRRTNS